MKIPTFLDFSSNGVLSEHAMCKTVQCRSNVALLSTGEVKFVQDANGFKWKCVQRAGLPSTDFGKGWACAELDCREANHGALKSGFRGTNDCTGVPCTVDGLRAESAPKKAVMYEPVLEALHETCTASSAIPFPVLALAMICAPQFPPHSGRTFL
eukprot:GEMP01056447.1.p1 GENE.GEMP01056447.1~~GEMP01056447.1.p1  ORF type:complete len:155 (+),score=34.92 GEMP01056447.1:566-1030(+)